jgi:hypothetical protein
VKNKIRIHLATAFLIICLASCSGDDKNVADNSLVEIKEKKETKPTKQKKKEKKKNTSFNKKKAENSATNSSVKEVETPALAENPIMIGQLADKISEFAVLNGYSSRYCFLVDMSLPSGRNRFFVYDCEKKSIVRSALVAHGCCNKSFMSHPKFSNAPDCGCTSLGKYKVGEFYHGQYGKSFRLYGLDNSNSNAFKRGVVIHGHDCVPDGEIYPRVLCNSFGCVMVSDNFFSTLSGIIQKSDKPIVLWVFG